MESIQQGHPQAAIMLEYAQAAATNKEPWKEFEYFNKYLRGWVQCTEEHIFHDYDYRRKPKVLHKIGNKYKWNDTIYILARTGPDTICLINTESGYRWSDQLTIEFSNALFVKHEDFNLLIGRPYIKEFALIND